MQAVGAAEGAAPMPAPKPAPKPSSLAPAAPPASTPARAPRETTTRVVETRSEEDLSAQRLRACVEYVMACGGTSDALSGWHARTETRKTGNSAGTSDTYFFAPDGRRYRSRNDVVRLLGLEPLRVPKERKRKAQAESAQGGSAGAALVGKRIEVYWDGEDAWFEAEVLSYDEKLRYHLVRYAADAQEIDEDLLGQPDSWRHVVVAAAATATPAAVGIGELQDRVGRAW